MLFKDQWKTDYPFAIVDTKTKNKSFLNYAALLRTMGIANCAWPLTLLNRDLQGVDPWAKDLSVEQILMITEECEENPWYFFRECVRASRDGDPFLANRANMALYWLFFNHVTAMLIQPRQTGKSYSSDVLVRYLTDIRCVDTEINAITKDDTLRASNLERLRDIESNMPWYLRRKEKGDIFNTEEYSINALGNNYRSHLPSKSEKSANNVGRGLTSPIFLIDEAAFLFNIGISLPAALAAGTAARDRARRNGDPYGTIITTTPGKKDDRDGRYIYDMLMHSFEWNEILFDCENEEKLHEMIIKNSPRKADEREGALRVNLSFSHRQLGYTDEWLRRAMRDANSTGEAAERDFLGRWTAGSQASPLSLETLETIKESTMEPMHVKAYDPYAYVLRWYVPENEIQRVMSREKVIGSLDTSDAAGGDDIAFVFRSSSSGEVIAAGNFNETNLIAFSEWLAKLLEMYPNLILVPERRSTGSSIIDYLLLILPTRGIDPFKRIFNMVVHQAEEFPDRFNEINRSMSSRPSDVYVKYKKYFGFATSANGITARSELFGTTLQNAAKYTGHAVKDKMTAAQILGLVIRNGRIDHEEGGHDDMCVAWLLGYWFLSNGRNLHFYGLDPRSVMSRNSIVRSASEQKNTYENMVATKLRQKLDELAERLKKERDPYVIPVLEKAIRNLAHEMPVDSSGAFSVEEFIESLKETRRRRKAVERI